QPADFVNLFTGTSNYGAVYPGPVAPRGMASESIVMEREDNNDHSIKKIQLDGKTRDLIFISHDDFVNGTTLKVIQN
ncbi:MAG TPA: hypothetical protein VF842_01380, partial [Flavobacterium sp.]